MDSDPVPRRQCHSEFCYKHAETCYKQKDVHVLCAHILYSPISPLHTTVSEQCASKSLENITGELQPIRFSALKSVIVPFSLL